MNRWICLLLLLALAPFAAAQNPRPIRVMTADDVGIAGSFYGVEATNAPAVVLLHGFSQTREEWNSFALLLQRNGFAVLSIDLRGHGESNRRITANGPQLIDIKSFTPRDYPPMLLDVNAAVDWLMEQPGINRKRIAIAGAGAGANLALRYALVNTDLVGLLLFSPGINYRGLRTDDAIRQAGKLPMRIIVSQQDSFAYESSKRLATIRKEEGLGTDQDLVVCSGNLFGTELIQGVKDLPAHVIPWLRFILLDEPLDRPDSAQPPAPPAPPAKPAKRP